MTKRGAHGTVHFFKKEGKRCAKKTFNKQENCEEEQKINNEIYEKLQYDNEALNSVFLGYKFNCDEEKPNIDMTTCDITTSIYTLNEWIENFSENEQAKTSIAIKLLQCIQHLHNNNIAHNDIKPDNIIVCAKRESGNPNDVRLIDFGFAVLDVVEETKKGNMRFGNPIYASPLALTDIIGNKPVFSILFDFVNWRNLSTGLQFSYHESKLKFSDKEKKFHGDYYPAGIMLAQLGLLEAAQPLLLGTRLKKYDKDFCTSSRDGNVGSHILDNIDEDATKKYNEQREKVSFIDDHDPIKEALDILERSEKKLTQDVANLELGPRTPEKNEGNFKGGGYSSITAGISISMGVATCIVASFLGALIE